MSNRRKKSWPSGFYSDGISYRMKTADGRFVRLGSNEARALRKFHQARRLEDAGDSIGAAASPRMTLRAVAERWFEAQQTDGAQTESHQHVQRRTHGENGHGHQQRITAYLGAAEGEHDEVTA